MTYKNISNAIEFAKQEVHYQLNELLEENDGAVNHPEIRRLLLIDKLLHYALEEL